MRVLVLDSDYPQFLAALYRARPGLVTAPYDEQLAERRLSLFGTASSYAAAFRELGHDAAEIFLNNGPMQSMWANEHGLAGVGPRKLVGRLQPRDIARRTVGAWRDLPEFVIHGVSEPQQMGRVLVAQVEGFRPDVVLDQNLGALSPELVRAVRARTRLLVGQHAATPLLPGFDLGPYDLVVSSFQPMVDELRERGSRAELSRLGFDPAVLGMLDDPPSALWGLTFVGSLAPIHSSRREFLERLAHLVPDLRIWSPDTVPRSSILHQRHMGVAWGRTMFQILRSSRATVNHHGDIAPYANNMRLFEATGVGTLLLTDAKPNLAEIFTPGMEVIEFGSAEDCAAAYLALDDDGRDGIAAAGQKRTLAEHTYVARVRELVRYVEPLLAGRGPRPRP
jgi:hypothetical protein